MAYEDKVARRGIRVCDLYHPDHLKEKIDKMLSHHNLLLKAWGAEQVKVETLYEELMGVSDKILVYAGVAWKRLDEENKAGKKILFEGAQGHFLDIDHGTYPYVTSSNTSAGMAAVGSGLGPSVVGEIGIVNSTANAEQKKDEQKPAPRHGYSTFWTCSRI